MTLSVISWAYMRYVRTPREAPPNCHFAFDGYEAFLKKLHYRCRVTLPKSTIVDVRRPSCAQPWFVEAWDAATWVKERRARLGEAAMEAAFGDDGRQRDSSPSKDGKKEGSLGSRSRSVNERRSWMDGKEQSFLSGSAALTRPADKNNDTVRPANPKASPRAQNGKGRRKNGRNAKYSSNQKGQPGQKEAPGKHTTNRK